jgi:hypothetical protein
VSGVGTGETIVPAQLDQEAADKGCEFDDIEELHRSVLERAQQDWDRAHDHPSEVERH